jgi:diguanylate cyclase (GGDEF)-like protein
LPCSQAITGLKCPKIQRTFNEADAGPADPRAGVGLAAIAAITVLQQRSDAGRDAELQLATVKIELNQLQTAPLRADRMTGGSPALARKLMNTGKQRIGDALADLGRRSPPTELRMFPAALRANYTALDEISAVLATGSGEKTERVVPDERIVLELPRSADRAERLLDAAGQEYDRRATRAQSQATIGSATAILLLLAAFAYFYRRSMRARSRAEDLARENERLLAASRVEALSDALTGLGNRRALINDLVERMPHGDDQSELVLGLFDLDGFKQYNDTFGHPAGDALLSRLGDRLQSALSGVATAYRMGGDEFCMLATDAADRGDELAQIAADALSDSGDAFEIECSYGLASVPADATTAEDALRIADQRMYAHKAGRTSASRQSTDVLLKVLSERSPDLDDHLTGVARLAARTAQHLGLPDHEVGRIRLGAELHDVGKTAIPEAILNKPGALDDDEWSFMRRHTLIGERIVRAAPSLAHVAELVRYSHERFDGGGYPDGLSGDEIPLGASIVAVCDAFDAMVSERPYRTSMSLEDALAEVRRCAGSQFDPAVVEAFCVVVNELALAPA